MGNECCKTKSYIDEHEEYRDPNEEFRIRYREANESILLMKDYKKLRKKQLEKKEIHEGSISEDEEVSASKNGEIQECIIETDNKSLDEGDQVLSRDEEPHSIIIEEESSLDAEQVIPKTDDSVIFSQSDSLDIVSNQSILSFDEK